MGRNGSDFFLNRSSTLTSNDTVQLVIGNNFSIKFSVEQAYVNQRKLETEAKQLQVHAGNHKS